MQLKIVFNAAAEKGGVDKNGLQTYYCTNIRSVSADASPVLYNFLSDTSKSKLEHVQDPATRIIEPGLEYQDRLKFLELPPLFLILFLVFQSLCFGRLPL